MIQNIRALVVVMAASYTGHALAQDYNVGARVQASPLWMDSDWKECEVVKIVDAHSYSVVCAPDNSTPYTVSRKWIRPTAALKETPQPAQEPATVPFKPGDPVLASPLWMTDKKYWKRCIFNDSTENYGVITYSVKCDGADYPVQPKYVEALPATSKPAPQPTPPREEAPVEASPAPAEAPVAPLKARTGKPAAVAPAAADFAVGERVKASPTGLKEDKYYQPCTILEIGPNPGGYKIRCDSIDGRLPLVHHVRGEWVRPWPHAKPAAALPECPMNVPPGTVSASAKPSAGLFQRVIYEQEANTIAGREVGMTFQQFKMGKKYKNILTGKGLLLDGAPEDVMVYPIKARTLTCHRYSEHIDRFVHDIEYACYKNEFEDWYCGNSAPTLKEKSQLPVE